jgi:threonine efflux protein
MDFGYGHDRVYCKIGPGFDSENHAIAKQRNTMHELIFLGTVGGLYLSVLWSPGPNFLVVSKAAMSESRRHGICTALGISSGTAVWSILAATGVGLLLARFEWARRTLQVFGGCYLVCLGLKAWRQAGRPIARGAEASRQRSLAQAYWSGLATCLTNPQALVFFTSIFANLFAQDLQSWLKLAGVGTIIVLALISYLIQATLLSSSRVQLGYIKAKRWIDFLSGGLLAAYGAGLLAG